MLTLNPVIIVSFSKPVALIHKFLVIHKIDLALTPFLFHSPPNPAALSAQIISQ